MTKLIRYLFFSFAIFVASQAYTQKDKVVFYGKVVDYFEGDKLDCEVELYVGGSKVQTVDVFNGSYEVLLEYDEKYTIKFAKDGYYTTQITIDTRDIPEEEKEKGNFAVNGAPKLFKELPGFDGSVLEETAATAEFDLEKNAIDWDMGYITAQNKRKTAVVDKYSKAIEEANKMKAQQQKQFDALVKAGDKAASSEDYTTAVEKYSAALELEYFKNDEDTRAKLIDAEYYLEEQKEKNAAKLAEEQQKQYDDKLKEAEAFVSKDEYESAFKLFQEADQLQEQLGLGDTQAKKRADFCKAQLDQIKQKEQEYNDLMSKAGTALGNKEFLNAINIYNQILSSVKPNDKTAKDKLEEASKLMAEYQKNLEKKEEYDAVIVKADEKFQSGFYEEAISFYKEAKGIITSETYPDEMIARAETAIKEKADAQEKEKEYTKLVNAGNESFEIDQFENAISNYEKAKAINDTDEIQNLLSKAKAALEQKLKDDADAKVEQERLAAIDEQYKVYIEEADKLFDSKSFEEAANKYGEALLLEGKENEEYPLAQIEKAKLEIDKIKAEQDAIEAKKLAQEAFEKEYQALLSNADAQLQAKTYEEAIASYNEAIEFKKASEFNDDDFLYPQDKLKEIGQILENKEAAEKAEADRIAALEEEYKNLVAEGDKLLSKEKYSEAIAQFQNALAIEGKGTEEYPLSKINFANDKLAEIEQQKLDALASEEKQKALDEQYEAFIAKAKEAKVGEQYEQAIQFYKEALAVEGKSNEKMPQDEINSLEAILQQIKNDQLANEAEAAEKVRQKAIQDSIEKANLAKQEQLDAKFNELISSADGLFQSKKYSESISKYTEALGVEGKSSEQYPQDQILKANKLIKEQEDLLSNAEKARQDSITKADKLQEDFSKLVDKGNKLFADEKYEQAIVTYEDALEIFNGETYVKNQITRAKKFLQDKIDKEQGELAAKKKQEDLDKNYAEAMSNAKSALKSEDYQGAIQSYKNASSLKPEEQEPKDEINRIVSLIEKLEQENAEKLAAQNAKQVEEDKKRQIEELLLEAKLAKTQEQYEKAIGIYSQLKGIDPLKTKNYDKQIETLNQLLAQQQAALLAQQQADVERAKKEADKKQKDEERLAKEAALRRKFKKNKTTSSISEDDAEEYFANQMNDYHQEFVEDVENQTKNRINTTSELNDGDNSLRKKNAIAVEKEYDKQSKHNKSETELYYEKARDFKQYEEKVYEDGTKVKEADNKFIYANRDEIDDLAEEISEQKTENTRARLENTEKINAIEEATKNDKANLALKDKLKRKKEDKKNNKLEDERSEQINENESGLHDRAKKVNDFEKQRKKEIKKNNSVDNKLISKNIEKINQIEDDQSRNKNYFSDFEDLLVENVEEETKKVIKQNKSVSEKDELNRAENVKTLEKSDIHHSEKLKEGEAYSKKVAEESKQGEIEVLKRDDEYDEQSIDLHKSNVNYVEDVEKNQADTHTELSLKDKSSRENAAKKLDKLEYLSPTYDEGYTSKLAEDFPQGVTEKVSQIKDSEGNITQVVVRRIVVKEKRGDDYQKVMSKHGTFYFKNGKGITKTIWKLETAVTQD